MMDFENEFSPEMQRLKITYGEKTFPATREQMFWKRYQHNSIKAFSLAVDNVVLRMPMQAQLVDFLDEQLRGQRTTSNSRNSDFQEYPINPRAKELADYYVPLIRAEIMKIGRPLPYDKTKRISNG